MNVYMFTWIILTRGLLIFKDNQGGKQVHSGAG